MNSVTGYILSLAYILGLLSTAIPQGQYALLVLAVGAAVVLPRFWRTAPKPGLLLVAGIVGWLAALYFQVRLPQPVADDISKFVPLNEVKEVRAQEQLVTVEGRVASMPRLTRTGRSQFWLEAIQLNHVKGTKNRPVDDAKAVKGKLYVTVPLLQATGLYPGQAIALTGILYKLKPANLPGGFNFQSYLAREGAFAGFNGRQISFPDEPAIPHWKGWALRQRIIRSQVRKLGSPEGILLSSIILGSRVVDLPYEIKDQFVQMGLAHALTAYGFKISLILGLVLTLTRRFSVRLRIGLGITALVIYVALTGLYPLALQAAVMGLAALITLVSHRKRQPWQLLLVVTTLMLLFNPLWLWDLELQLSFLATLGFLVSVQPIAKRLDGLSPVLASIIAVPLATSLWTLPLQIYAFNSSIYSILVIVITAIPLLLIGITGTISAIAASIWPLAGSTIAGLLYYPIHWLILLVQFFCHASDGSATSSTISVLQLVALYGLLCLVWLQPWWQRRWWLAGFIAASLVFAPTGQSQVTGLRVTALSTDGTPILVIQDQGKVTLINSGDADTVSSTVLPFLQQQEISQIDWAIATDSQNSSKVGWPHILAQVPVKTLYFNDVSRENSEVRIQEEEDTSKRNRQSRHSLSSSFSTNDSSVDTQATLRAAQLRQVERYPLSVGQTLSVGSTTMKIMSIEPPVLQLQIRNQIWLLVGNLKLAHDSKSLRPMREEKLAITRHLPHASVLCWPGELFTDLLQVVQPAVAIASSATIESDTTSVLPTSNIKLYWTGRDGAVQWTPSGEFETTLEATENDGSLL